MSVLECPFIIFGTLEILEVHENERSKSSRIAKEMFLSLMNSNQKLRPSAVEFAKRFEIPSTMSQANYLHDETISRDCISN